MIKKDHADGGPFRRRLTTSTLGVDYFWTPIMAYFSVPIDSPHHIHELWNSRTGSTIGHSERLEPQGDNHG